MHAFRMTVVVMISAIIGTAILINSEISASIPLQEYLMLSLLISEMYIFFLIGFTFPGQANYFSVKIKKVWKSRQMFYVSNHSSCSLDIRIEARFIRSCPIIKIRFGSDNYYDRMTALVVTNFEIQKSLKLMLLMK